MDERRYSDGNVSLGWSSGRAGQWAGEGEAGGGGHRRDVFGPWYSFYSPRTGVIVRLLMAGQVSGTRPGQRQVLNKYLLNE